MVNNIRQRTAHYLGWLCGNTSEHSESGQHAQLSCRKLLYENFGVQHDWQDAPRVSSYRKAAYIHTP
jgi:hypothetical protein